MYGFIMRSSSEFKRTSTYLYLYKSLVRSQVEYAVPIWNPYYSKYVDAIERVQRKYLQAMHYRCHRKYLTYPQLLIKYNMLSLESRRLYLEVTNLYKIVNNYFDCNSLVNSIYYIVPRSTHMRAVHEYFLFAVGAEQTVGVALPMS